VSYTQKLMELLDVLLLLGVFIPVFIVVIWQLNRLNPIKKAAKAGDSSIKELYSVYNDQVSDVLKIKDKVIASLQAKLRNYEEETEEEPEEVADLVKNPEIQKLLQQKGINPALLENPVIQKYIKKYTKGMSIEQVIEIGQQLGFLKGNKQSQGGLTQESEEYRTDWA